MKSILLSVRPEWVAKILNGEKTIEVRKTAPKDWVDYLSGKTDKKPEPKTVYIYCTKEDDLLRLSQVEMDRFITGKDFDIKDYCRLHSAYNGKGKVVAKFTLKTIGSLSQDSFVRMEDGNGDYILKDACLSLEEIKGYTKGNDVYLWYVSDLVIFDRPKELGEFGYKRCEYSRCINCEHCEHNHCSTFFEHLTKAPQSWCYCEERYPGATMRKIELPKEVEAKPYKKGKR